MSSIGSEQTISDLQKKLYPLLGNIIVNGQNVESIGKFNIADTTTDNIYKIPENQANLDKDNYKTFLEFMIRELQKNNSDYKNNTGEILTAHYVDTATEQDKQEIDEIKQKYNKLFLLTLKSKIDKKNNKLHIIIRYKNNSNQQYPFWISDLKDNSKSVLYKEIEDNLNIKDILQQDDNTFLQTIQKRINEIYESSKTETDKKIKSFYQTEYTKYIEILTKNKNLDINQQIKELCNNTLWGIKDYEHSKKAPDEINKEFISFKKFIEETPNELNFMKTFIPQENFNGDIPDWEKIKQFMIHKNRTFRQYIFGYTEDIEKYAEYRTFFELLGMDYSKNSNQNNLLILWNMVSNLYYNRCAISNNDIPFSLRFILPNNTFNLINTKDNTFTIKKTIPINPFINKYKLNFIGFINIKFYHEQSKQFRNWILLLFINNDLENEIFLDYFTGHISKIIILDYKYEYVNNGALLSRNAVTYEELNNFTEYQKQNKITIYQSQIEPKNVLFITSNKFKNLNLDSLLLKKIIIYYKKQNDFKFQISYINNNVIHVGGNIIKNIEINFNINKINLYDDTLTTTKTYSEYFKTINLINKYDDDIVYKCYKVLYNYILISNDEIKYSFLNHIKFEKKYHIPKYIPLSNKFFSLYEIFIKYNIFNNINKDDNILNIGYNMTSVEIIKFNNYKINMINCIIPTNSDNYYKYISNEWKKQLSALSGIYNVNINFYKDSIYNLINEDLKKNKLVVYTIYSIDNALYDYENFLNTNNIFLGMLIGLKYTDLNGIFIMHFGSVAYKHLADIYYILKKYFKTSELYYPEICNKTKKTGVCGIFIGYKGIKDTEFNNLLDIFHKINKINLLEDIKNININTNNTKNTKNINIKYISNFLKNLNYDEVIEFNNTIYIDKLIFVNKVLSLLKSENYTNIKVPTQDQIVSSILYCRKYNIPIFDKYSITKQDNIITKTILFDMYGLHEPILYKYSFLGKSRAKNSFLRKSRAKNSFLKTSKTRQSSNSFFNDIFKSSKKSSKTQKTQKSKKSSKTQKSRFQYNASVSLEEAVFNSNNQLIQVGRLIDSRKDFTKTNPTEVYDKLKDQLRFYKGTGKMGKDNRHIQNLDVKVQQLLGDFSISQAWLKMYEIITDCNLIPTNRKGVYRSFHICEAPGTFINCINNYINTKTQYDSYEWKSQSLRPSGKQGDKTIGDTYGLIKRHPNNWDWGVDGTGDITNIENIRHYAKVAKSMNANLMTSDCGLPWGDPKYYHVAFASYVSILCSLPNNGTLLYKILSPIDIPLMWNLIYITYTNFKEMYFFKPVQNSQSREFYIIGKGYLGTDQKVLDKLISLVDKFGSQDFNKEEYDMYSDMYPEEFVIQVQNICERLALNYVNSIEKIIYYVDNIDSLGKDYQKHIEDYVKEKNEDWIKKYKPRILLKSAQKL